MRPTKPAAALVGLIIAVFSVLISFTTSAQAAPTATSCVGGYPPSQCTVALSASTVTPGGTLSFSASGFNPGESVQGTIFSANSAPMVVGTWTANSSGVVSGSFTVPTSLSLGAHTFQLTGLSSGVIKTAKFTVVAGASSGSKSALPFTGANVIPLVGAGAALVLGGGAAVAVTRRRKNTQSAA